MSGSGNWRALCALNDANTLHMDTKLDNILLTEGVGFDDLLLTLASDERSSVVSLLLSSPSSLEAVQSSPLNFEERGGRRKMGCNVRREEEGG